jgi:hypothetical protein
MDSGNWEINKLWTFASQQGEFDLTFKLLQGTHVLFSFQETRKIISVVVNLIAIQDKACNGLMLCEQLSEAYDCTHCDEGDSLTFCE